VERRSGGEDVGWTGRSLGGDGVERRSGGEEVVCGEGGATSPLTPSPLTPSPLTTSPLTTCQLGQIERVAQLLQLIVDELQVPHGQRPPLQTRDGAEQVRWHDEIKRDHLDVIVLRLIVPDPSLAQPRNLVRLRLTSHPRFLGGGVISRLKH
jgi:hypothetical protein